MAREEVAHDWFSQPRAIEYGREAPPRWRLREQDIEGGGGVEVRGVTFTVYIIDTVQIVGKGGDGAWGELNIENWKWEIGKGIETEN